MRRKKRNQGPQEVQALVNVTERRTGVWGFQRTDPYSQQGHEDQQRWTEPEAGGLSFSGMEAGEAVRGPSCGSGDVGGEGQERAPRDSMLPSLSHDPFLAASELPWCRQVGPQWAGTALL